MDPFNLLEKPWIPVLYGDGRCERVGIRQALTEAHHIRQVAASNPMDRLAILRFLLALLYWCKGNPSPEFGKPPDALFPLEWFARLDKQKECFNLFGENRTFYQYRNKDLKKEKMSTPNYLIQEVPTGHNAWHFRHSIDGIHGLCPACCVLGLLRLPLFATSAGRGYSPGLNGKPPVYVFPFGRTLAETLLLAWHQASNLGDPCWVSPSMALPREGEVPLLMGLTWIPRRVWLQDPEKPESPCISCGQIQPLVRKTVFAPIGSIKTDSGEKERFWKDPYVLYLPTKNSQISALQPGDALKNADAAAGQWAKVLDGLCAQIDLSNVLVWIVGFSSVQNDKYLEAAEQFVFVPSQKELLQKVSKFIEQWQKGFSKIKKNLRSSEQKKKKKEPIEITSLASAIRPHIEQTVSMKVGALIEGTSETWERATEEYRPMIRMISKSLSPGFTTAAMERRKKIATAIPDMSPNTEKVKKTDGKEGEDK